MLMGLIKPHLVLRFKMKVGKILKKNCLKLFFYILDRFDVLISKIIFKNKKILF